MARKLFRKLGLGGALAAGLATAAWGAAPAPAHACGGLFCSSANPVNQAAEQIIFVDNPDGTVTAVIQILYEGPAHQFAWVLPVPGNPTVGVSSDQAFATLKQATNPLYQLQTRFADGCAQSRAAFGNTAMGAAGGPATADGANGGVSVVASGAIGPYVYDTISVDPNLDDPADAAVMWLEQNDYDVGMIGKDVLRPYFEEGLNLIAFKLNKTNGVGSIRPVLLTYESGKPSIPIRPTAVAANEDMGVMVFLLSDARGIPDNYKALELNEALIDWFNPNNNYNKVVSLAADEAMGQGFVTEFAGPHQNQGIQIFPDWQEQQWQSFQSTEYTDGVQMIGDASNQWAGWDGFDDALQKAVTLPESVTFADFKNCIRCYTEEAGFAFDTSEFRLQLYQLVIKPMMDTQALFDSRPYLTRLYTTMSADEMTMDPAFSFNPDLDDVSNVHIAEQVLECTDTDPFGQNSGWTVNLPQGGAVRGSGARVWPIDVESQPAAIRILQYGTSGDGKVLDDRSDLIAEMIKEQNGGTVSNPNKTGGTAGTPSSGTGGTGGSSTKTDSGKAGIGVPGATSGEADDEGDGAKAKSDGGCNAANAQASDGLSLLLLAGLALLRRRRR